MNRMEGPGRVLLFGAGALARELFQVIRDIASIGREAECVGFAIDEGFPTPDQLPLPAVSDWVGAMRRDSSLRLIVALGDPGARARVVERAVTEVGGRFATLVHPLVWVGSDVSIGEGSMLFGHVSATTAVKIGCHVLVNPGSTLAHDVSLADFATLGPSVALAGHVVVETKANLGTGSIVLPRLRIGAEVVVGAGSVVTQDIPAGTTVLGIPARARGSKRT